jgi:hypothetical protein
VRTIFRIPKKFSGTASNGLNDKAIRDQSNTKGKFIAAAQELDGDEKAFDAALKRIGSAKVVAGKPKAKPSKKSL